MNAPQHHLDRRSLLRLSALSIGTIAIMPLSGCGFLERREALDTVGQVDFRNRLRIPSIATGTFKDGTRTFDLDARAGSTAIVSSGDTKTWGVNGSLLGPTLRARRGESVRIDFANSLSEPTSMHWHGMHLPAGADGGPHQMVAPGSTWSPSWTIDQPAATLWYHPHPHGHTERHVYRGLGGLFIVDDEESSALSLPHDYGVDDIPLIVQDKTFDERGQLVESSRRDNGMLGDTVLVNGTAAPILHVNAQLTRLRILNASTARCYSFGFSDDREFTMIASDGGLLRTPARLHRIMLTPGERAEVVVELGSGDTTILRSFPQDLGLARSRSRNAGAHDTLDILLLKARETLRPSAAVPARLALIDPPAVSSAAKVRDFELGDNRINGKSMDMDRIDEVVTMDTTEVWQVRNGHTQPHNFHIHDVQFQVVAIADSSPPPELAGWKDTVYVPSGVQLKLMMRFTDHTDPHLPYMYHCHLLRHEDHGMMGQFVVVKPGQPVSNSNNQYEH